MELGFSALTRRERLERIARAERDRRAGRGDLAVAALGEATEWPARVIKALARIPASEAAESRRILEEGLDVWARESGLGSLEDAAAIVDDAQDRTELSGAAGFDETANRSLDRPIEIDELERAFSEAEAQTDEMHDANRVAERVLMDEPIGLSEYSDDAAESSFDSEFDSHAVYADAVEMDAAEVEPFDARGASGASIANVTNVESNAMQTRSSTLGRPGRQTSNEIALATLERWLANLERNKQFRAGRAQ